jgi:hypothetical protein
MVERDDWEHWHTGESESLEHALAALLEGSDRSVDTTVFYHSPSLNCDLYSCPGTVRDKVGAAHLALAELSSLNLDTNPWCIQPLESDRRGEGRRSHLLIAADSEDSVQRVRSIAKNARRSTLIPIQAPLIASSVDAALEASCDDQAVVVVHFGQSRSVIAAAHDRRLLLVRPVDVGTDRLIQALASALNFPADQSLSIAHQVLFGHGLPTADQTIVLGEVELTSADILPAIQPVLQRLLVEVRQSVRFGLSGLEQPPVILVRGSGVAIPRLTDALGTELQARCEPDRSHPIELTSDIAFAIEALERGLSLSLRCRSETISASSRSSKLALYAGSAAAIVLGAGYAVWTIGQTNDLKPQLAELSAIAPGDQDTLDGVSPTQSLALVSSVRRTIDSIDHFAGSETDIAAALREVCQLIADEAVLTDMEFSNTRDSSGCRIRGYLRNPSSDAGGQIRTLLNRLQASPLVESVRLEGTEVSMLDDQPTQYFAASITLSKHPRQILPRPATLASAETEQSP